ncbi:hypothetical protein H0H81_004952 [Sphagnurus paluster]|uniref:Uncharacterized protein n=1 Tax=Sphagnurus paluster TaxID=117069 RepID=A0A9P7KMD2_9AGAR|nr:hypothetical protein H0H81_004952 [Sphagnurus paluster]
MIQKMLETLGVKGSVMLLANPDSYIPDQIHHTTSMVTLSDISQCSGSLLFPLISRICSIFCVQDLEIRRPKDDLAAKAYEAHCAKNGAPDNHAKAKEILHQSERLEADTSVRSSTPFLATQIDSTSTKAAFLVGFFGSPAWETSAVNLVSLYGCSDHVHSLNSRRSKASPTPFSSLSNSASLQIELHSFSVVSTVDDIRIPYKMRDATVLGKKRKSHSLRLPIHPSKVHTGSPILATRRRFSFPSLGPRDVTRVGYGKSPASLNATSAKRSDISAFNFPVDSSLRLVELNNGLDYTLPLSLGYQGPTTQNKLFISSPSRSTKNSSIPLSRLPTLQHPSSLPESEEQSNSFLQISHPYALIQSTNTSFPSSPIKTCGSDLVTKTGGQNAVTRKPLSPVLGSVNLGPLFVPYPEAAFKVERSPDLNPMPKPNILPKVNQKTNKSSIRVRRSPAIGPSPLRAMILPDPSDSNANIRESVSHNAKAKTDYSPLGFGFRSTARAEDLIGAARANGATTKEDDPNLLMGIIRELVDETSQWDRSLFKDKNFKKMIEDSKQPLSERVDREPTLVASGSAQDKSTELGLNPLVLDIFRSGGETFLPRAEVGRQLGQHTEPDATSFWEDSGWSKDGDTNRRFGSLVEIIE